jgi:Flp pilus assembly pilin Flp
VEGSRHAKREVSQNLILCHSGCEIVCSRCGLDTCSCQLQDYVILQSVPAIHCSEGVQRLSLGMTKIIKLVRSIGLRKDQLGQDTVEYALLAGFSVVAAGALMPDVAIDIGSVLSKVGSTLRFAAGA